MLCEADEACTYNMTNGGCENFECNDLDDMSTECEAHANCGHYDYEDDVCAASGPAYTDDCSVLNGWKVACGNEDDCEYDSDSNECSKKSSGGGGGSGGSGSSSSASHLSVSLILAIVLALLF